MAQADPSLAAKVAFLRQPGSYPERPSAVEVIETHHSWVFLLPNQVYKLKKPVHYDYLDLRALAARRHNCREEVRLNRQLAPAIYLGVAALRLASDRRLTLTGAGVAVDYLVVMQRLPDDRSLQTQLQQGKVQPAEVDQAADRLAAFYLAAAPEGPADLPHWQDELTAQAAELALLLPALTAAAHSLHTGLQCWLERNRTLLNQRQLVEVHGDLRPQHIYLGATPIFIDRLEFNRRLRLLDPVEELAFLALECDRLGGDWVGRRFLGIYRADTGDLFPTELAEFYKARRALLWALLSARHTARGGGLKWEARGRDYLQRGWAALLASGSDTERG